MLLQMAEFLFFFWTVVYTHHVFFTHSSADEHLDCFDVLAAVTNAAVDIGVLNYCCWFFPEIYTGGYNPRSTWSGT